MMASVDNNDSITVPQGAGRAGYHQGWIAMPFATVFVFLLCIDARISLGLNVLFAEIAMLVFLVSAVVFNRFVTVPKSAFYFFLPVALISCITMAITDDSGQTLSTVRNIISSFLAIVAMVSARLNLSQRVFLLKVFVSSGVVCAILGVHQSLFGTDNSITVFNMNLSDNAGSGTEFALNWKLNNLAKSQLFIAQKSLAIGLHQYSNNFAEFLVYVTIALFSLKNIKKISRMNFVISLTTLSAAILFAQSRTCQIAFLAICIVQTILSFRKGAARYYASFIIIALSALIAPFVWLKYFSYDGFGTVEGRADLDNGAIDAAGTNIVSILFGGHVKSFYDIYGQDPHNILIFLWLQLGLLSTVIIFMAFLYLCGQIYKYRSNRNLIDYTFCNGALVACVWLFTYGMTWSVINVGLAGMTWAFIVGLAFGRGGQEADDV